MKIKIIMEHIYKASTEKCETFSFWNLLRPLKGESSDGGGGVIPKK